ncbi:putative valyl-tRNA synthetase [Candidatus Carsonella ruddii CS isolate Thao2000]|uniref:valine--tRNA ligase n=2 Tax=Carsonella ruddii TaxID=114186 RepID=J7H0F2_CARRU|nr:class I tRNA ligase family protein [Candidatus Carsonella ruddii]AFP83785.1 putative valyl-tRNA synthetase [Candidatus Carsonella ruddii CS isolate Thao2000]
MNNFILKKKFYVVLPPPNITGELHIGHFFQYFIIDIIIKWKISQGYKIYFLLGFDHAGISTIIKFKKKKNILIYKKYLKKKFKNNLLYINFLIKKKSIEFTLNKNYKKCLIIFFYKLIKKKYIYLDKKFVYFDFKIKSTISEIEIKKKYCFKYIFYIKYNLNKLNIIVYSKNIESIPFDNILISNCYDIRYNFLKNKIYNPFKKKINLFFSKKINKNFASGVIRLSNYFKNYLYLKKNFEIISYLNEKLKIKIYLYKYLNNKFIKSKKKFLNYKINFYTLKKNVLNYLILNNYLICIKKYKTFILINEKNNCKIISILTDQFFFKIRKILSIKKIFKKIIIFPKKYKNLCKVWIKNISDWCISRQINFGIKIPFYKDKYNNLYNFKIFRFFFFYKINDVFDTWFNSSIWIIFIYKKIKKKQNILISGFDILFFWIIKMIINNIIFFKNTLIEKIFLHGIIRNKNNEKFSKSMNNILNFNKLKNMFFIIKKNLLKNSLKENIKIIIIKKKKYYIYYKKNFIIIYYYKFKFNIIKYYKNYNFYQIFNLKKKISYNFISKKIFLLMTKLLFPINNKILTKKWNFTINFYYTNYFLKKIIIIKIFKKNYLLKNLRNINYFEIFFKLKIIFYVKYKNKTF